jgi:hypothetical protein
MAARGTGEPAAVSPRGSFRGRRRQIGFADFPVSSESVSDTKGNDTKEHRVDLDADRA